MDQAEKDIRARVAANQFLLRQLYLMQFLENDPDNAESLCDKYRDGTMRLAREQAENANESHLKDVLGMVEEEMHDFFTALQQDVRAFLDRHESR